MQIDKVTEDLNDLSACAASVHKEIRIWQDSGNI